MRVAVAFVLACLTCSQAHALEPLPVAPAVYAFIGDLGEPSAANGGNIGNSGFIVGADGVIVVDTGISYRRGQAMLAAIARVTDKPVQLAIITGGVQESLFGNAAFAERGIALMAHAESVKLIRQRCEQCLENLRKVFGVEAMTGTRVVLPERIVLNSVSIEIAGRTLDLLHFGWAATPGDLAVYDRASGVLFAGGLVSVQRIPDLRDGRLDAWLEALGRLGAVRARIVVPGHGPVSKTASVEATRAYLLALDARVRALYGRGRGLLDALDEADLPEYREWALYPSLHRKNVQHRYLELEALELEGG